MQRKLRIVMLVRGVSKWTRTEKQSSGPFPIIEYRYEKSSCVIRCTFRTYDGGISYHKAGWDVICIFRNGEMSFEKIAWFRHLKDAQFWVEVSSLN